MLDRVLNTCIDGRAVRINVMQPLAVNFVADDKLPPEKRTATVLAKYKEVSSVNAALPKVRVRRLSPKPLIARDFEIPKAYIKYRVRHNEEMDSILEYDVDEEDVEWLKVVSKKLENAGERPLGVHSFEVAMDRLEKESFFQCSKSGSYKCVVDQDALCCVCNDGEGSNINQIIFCDMCNIAVHQDCYGVPYVPEGQWLCRRCQMSPSEPVSCVLCPSSHGAFKQTVDNRWAHVVCALWLNEVHFANSVFMEPIDGVENSLRRRCRLRCIVCKQKMGACLQCSRKSCTRSFHVTCANAAGMEMRAEIVDNPKREGGTEVRYTAFCHFHSTDFIKSGVSDCSKHKKKVDEMMKKAREKLAASQAVIPPVSIPTVPIESVKKICEKAHISEAVMRYVVAYWSLKRKARFGVPLLRRLIHSKTHPKSLETAPASGQDARFMGEFGTYFLLRTNLERVRLLCELVKKREKVKKEYYDSTASLLNRLTKPLSTIMSEVIEKIACKDYSDVFTKPVTEKEVPGYSTVIKNPMDLSTMRKKLGKGEYKYLSQLKDDFTLMMNNCSTFNRHNEFFWKYGHRLHRIGLKYFRVAEKEVQALTLASGVLKTISSVSYTPVEGFKFDNEEENEEELEGEPEKPLTSRSPKGDKGAPVRASTRKRTLRSFDDDLPQKRSKYDTAAESFNTYRNSSLKSPKFMTTDTSAVEESSSAEDELPLRQGRRRSSKRFHRDFPSPPVERPVETVEVACEFQHDDTVWITENGERKVGRVIDLRMRIILGDLPLDEMFNAKPQDYAQYVLVVLFDGHQTWRWVPVESVSYCVVKSIKVTDYPPDVQESLREARKFLGLPTE